MINQSGIIYFFPVHFKVHKYEIGMTLPHLFLIFPSSNKGWLLERNWANKLIVVSRITFETMKKLVRFRSRPVLIHFISYMLFIIHPWILLTSLGSWRKNFLNVAFLQFPIQLNKTYYMSKIYEDTWRLEVKR